MREYIDSLRDNGELLTVDRQVNPKHELAAVTKAVQKQRGAPLLFTNVMGTRLPVVTNLYSNRGGLCRLIGADDDGFCRQWTKLVDKSLESRGSPLNPGERPANLIEGKLSDLPLITYHERDAGPYFTSGIFLAKDPETEMPNLSFHRAMYVSDSELRIRLGESHDLAKYQLKAETMGKSLEVAMLIGVEPSLFMAACTSIPSDRSELNLASVVAGTAIDTYAGETVNLQIPRCAQIVIEGRIKPNLLRDEGPFGEFLGYYVPQGKNHVFEITKVYWYEEAIFHSLLCGSAEDLSVLEAVTAARTYSHLVKSGLPGIIDVSCSPAFMNTTIKIDQQYEGHARQVLMSAFGAHIDYGRVCFVVDEDIDITNMDEVVWAYVTRGRVDERLMVIENVPGFYRDPHKDYWGRVGIDATAPHGRKDEFVRKRVPGEDDINLNDYLT